MCYETTGHDITTDAANHEPGLDVIFKQVDNRHLVLQEVKIQKPEHGKICYNFSFKNLLQIIF